MEKVTASASELSMSLPVSLGCAPTDNQYLMRSTFKRTRLMFCLACDGYIRRSEASMINAAFNFDADSVLQFQSLVKGCIHPRFQWIYRHVWIANLLLQFCRRGDSVCPIEQVVFWQPSWSQLCNFFWAASRIGMVDQVVGLWASWLDFVKRQSMGSERYAVDYDNYFGETELDFLLLSKLQHIANSLSSVQSMSQTTGTSRPATCIHYGNCTFAESASLTEFNCHHGSFGFQYHAAQTNCILWTQFNHLVSFILMHVLL